LTALHTIVVGICQHSVHVRVRSQTWECRTACHVWPTREGMRDKCIAVAQILSA